MGDEGRISAAVAWAKDRSSGPVSRCGDLSAAEAVREDVFRTIDWLRGVLLG